MIDFTQKVVLAIPQNKEITDAYLKYKTLCFAFKTRQLDRLAEDIINKYGNENGDLDAICDPIWWLQFRISDFLTICVDQKRVADEFKDDLFDDIAIFYVPVYFDDSAFLKLASAGGLLPKSDKWC